MSIDEQPMNVYWSGKRTETVNKFKTDFKGSVEEYTDLPSEGNKKGDMYNVIEDSNNYIWNGESWSKFALDIDSALSLESENPLQNKVITNALSKKINIANGVNWQKSEKAGAVAIYPVPETVLEPIIDFLFTETPPASGDKGPDNPSTITGVSSVNVLRWGKNINNDATASYSRYATRDSDGWITGIVSADINSAPAWQCRFDWQFPTDIDYCAVIEVAELVNSNGLMLSTHPTDQVSQLGNNNVIITTTGVHVVPLYYYKTRANGAINLIRPVTRSKITANQEYRIKYRISVLPVSANEIDPSTWNYEAYTQQQTVLNLGNTYYGGILDVASGVMTVTHVAVTPDASTVDISSAPAALPLDYADTYGRAITSADGTSLVVGSTGGTVVYKLATPQTAQLAPAQILSLAQSDKYTPRLNTVYTDAQAVQVGYAKSPICSEYELTQAIIATEGGE